MSFSSRPIELLINSIAHHLVGMQADVASYVHVHLLEVCLHSALSSLEILRWLASSASEVTHPLSVSGRFSLVMAGVTGCALEVMPLTSSRVIVAKPF